MSNVISNRIETGSFPVSVLPPKPHLSIIGGGPAGLAVGYYARKHHVPFSIYEAEEKIGGNCRTIQHGEFRFDTGAHRLHDKDPDVTAALRELMGDELQRIDVPSQILFRNKFIDFPLSPLNLIRSYGIRKIVYAGLNLIRARLFKPSDLDSFEGIATHLYGKTIARDLLFSYSEKLWGMPAAKLSPSVSGQRLRGLSFKTFVDEALNGARSKTEHLDGCFYYPRRGIGSLMDGIADACGNESIHRRTRITRVCHDNERIHSIEINLKAVVSVGELVSTLPLPVLLGLMDPKPPREILSLARKLRYRNVLLVVLFLNRKQVTPNASLYFPDPDILFTRGYEPKNRCPDMSPPDKTSFVVEIPYDIGQLVMQDDSEKIIREVSRTLEQKKLIRQDEVLDGLIYHMPYAYPVLEKGFQEGIAHLAEYLGRFSNLNITGRSGNFAYMHMHDVMAEGRDLVKELAENYAAVSA